MGHLSLNLFATSIPAAEKVLVEVDGSDVASVTVSPETRQGAGWAERTSFTLPRGAKTLRLTVSDASGVLGSSEHPLDKVLAADLEEAALPLQAPDGSSRATLTAVLRYFHGRSEGAGAEDHWASLHRQVSRQASLRAQLVR